jgi:hypothetical protein
MTEFEDLYQASYGRIVKPLCVKWFDGFSLWA